MILKKNSDTWIEAGAMIAGFNPKFSEMPVSLRFADELGSDGWEMFNVVEYVTHGRGGTSSAYFFKREI